MGRQITEGRHPAFQIFYVGEITRLGTNFGHSRFQEQVKRAQIYREPLVVIADEEFCVEFEPDASALELLAVLQSKYRQQQLVFQLGLQRTPIDIEVISIT